MKIEVGTYDAKTRTVSVVFSHGEGDDQILHARQVNACLDASGDYDSVSTADRIADIARGVEVKIALGVISSVQTTSPPEVTL